MEQGFKCKTLNYKTWEKSLHNLQLGRILTLDTTSMIHVWKSNKLIIKSFALRKAL